MDPRLGFYSRALYVAAVARFKGKARSFNQFVQHSHSLQNGRILNPSIPKGSDIDVTEIVLRLPWKTALITSDYQVPYHDEALVEKAFLLGAAWNVEGHVLNADVFDMATMSKFPQQIFGERVQLGEELKIGQRIIAESKKLHREVAFNTGNHEWRVVMRLLHGELDTDQVRNLLAGEGVLYTPLSYCWLGYEPDHAVRITHPRAVSVIPGAVGADIARNHDCHVVVAHDHLLAQRRSHSGRWTVVHSGMMADPRKLMYAVTADDRRPLMNQGFCIVHPDAATGQPRLRLIDPKNTDWDLEFYTARKERVGS